MKYKWIVLYSMVPTQIKWRSSIANYIFELVDGFGWMGCTLIDVTENSIIVEGRGNLFLPYKYA